MKKIISISLAIILLLSNAGFAVATHYCGGQAVKSSIVLGNAWIDCGMKMEKECANTETKGVQITKTPCCQNEYQSLDVEDDYKPTIVQSNVHVEFVVSSIIFSILLPLSVGSNETEYAICSPPFLERDVPALQQVFLI